MGKAKAARAAATAGLAAALIGAWGAPAAQAAAPVPCTAGTGDTGTLAAAVKVGGDITLTPSCTYTFVRAHGDDSVLPTITRDTRIDGKDSRLVWAGGDQASVLFEVDGAELDVRNLEIDRGRLGLLRVRGSGSSVSVSGGSGSWPTTVTESEPSQAEGATDTGLGRWLRF